MNLCSDKHDEVCYEGHNCPLCVLISDHETTVRDYESTADDLRRELKELQEELDTANSEVERLCKGQLDGER